MPNNEERNQLSSGSVVSADEQLIFNRRCVLLEHLNLIPVFTAQDPNWPLKKFINKIQEISTYLKWSDEDKYFVMQQRLAGQAHQTYQNFKHEINDFPSLLKVLESQFLEIRDTAQVLTSFWNFKQSPSVSVAEFIAMARNLAQEAVQVQNLPLTVQTTTRDAWLLSMLMNNLAPEIRRGVVARDPQNLEELIKIAVLEEKSWKAIHGDNRANLDLTFPSTSVVCAAESFKPNTQLRARSPVQTVKKEFEAEQIQKLTEKIQNLEEKIENLAIMNHGNRRENIVRKTSVRCWKCGKVGHIQSRCEYSRDSALQRRNFSNSYRPTNRFFDRAPSRSPSPNFRQNGRSFSPGSGRSTYQANNRRENRGVSFGQHPRGDFRNRGWDNALQGPRAYTATRDEGNLN